MWCPTSRFQLGDALVSLLRLGDSFAANYRIRITAELKGNQVVPEPSALGLVGLLGLLGWRGRKCRAVAALSNHVKPLGKIALAGTNLT
jgi:PEP-CTERM motif